MVLVVSIEFTDSESESILHMAGKQGVEPVALLRSIIKRHVDIHDQNVARHGKTGEPKENG